MRFKVPSHSACYLTNGHGDFIRYPLEKLTRENKEVEIFSVLIQIA